MTWTDKDWDERFRRARANNGLLVSKVGVPKQFHDTCDHRESVWEFHQAAIRRAMHRHGFHIAYETRNVVSIVPRVQDSPSAP